MKENTFGIHREYCLPCEKYFYLFFGAAFERRRVNWLQELMMGSDNPEFCEHDMRPPLQFDVLTKGEFHCCVRTFEVSFSGHFPKHIPIKLAHRSLAFDFPAEERN